MHTVGSSVRFQKRTVSFSGRGSHAFWRGGEKKRGAQIAQSEATAVRALVADHQTKQMATELPVRSQVPGQPNNMLGSFSLPALQSLFTLEHWSFMPTARHCFDQQPVSRCRNMCRLPSLNQVPYRHSRFKTVLCRAVRNLSPEC